MGATFEWGLNLVICIGFKGLFKVIDVNMNVMFDVVMIFVVVVFFVDGIIIIRDVASWRVKEIERMIAICIELRKFGCDVFEGVDYCVIIFFYKFDFLVKMKVNVDIDIYDDYRMVMVFVLVACGDVDVVINDSKCTKKIFLMYFDVFKFVVK